MTTLRQFRSSGPMRAPCSRGLSLGPFMPNVYWVLFLFVPTTGLSTGRAKKFQGKYDHVCDQWVTDKGPKGRCLSAKHKRGECDNPNKCDQAAQ